MAANVIYQGVVAPDALRVPVTAGDSGYDLTTVTGVSLIVRLPDSTVVTWPAAIDGTPTPSDLVAVHLFQPSDTAQIGTHAAFLELDLPGGVTRTEPAFFEVVDPFAAPPQ